MLPDRCKIFSSSGDISSYLSNQTYGKLEYKFGGVAGRAEIGNQLFQGLLGTLRIRRQQAVASYYDR